MCLIPLYGMATNPERAHRLRQAMKAADMLPPKAHERWGWNINTLRSNMNGNMAFSYKKALLYAGRLKVRAEWLYSGEGPMREPAPRSRRPDHEVPVIAWVSAGKVADIGQIEEIGELERITVSGLPAGEYFATDVIGDSMDRVSPENSRIIVRIGEGHPIEGGYYVFSLNGETTYKRYYDDPVIRLEPHSTNPANRPIFPRTEGWSVVGQVVRSFIDLDRG